MTDLLLLGAGRGSAGTFTEAEAIYSLRAVDGFSGPVVRLRRHYNSDEQDFTAAELVSEELTSELLANNDMQASEWANSGGWTFSSGVASLVSTAGNSNFLSLSTGIWGGGYQYYKVTFTIDSCSDFDKVGLVMGSATYRRFQFFGIEAPGTYTVLLDNDERPQNIIRFFANQGDDGSTCSISYFSVKAYSPSAAELFAFPAEARNAFTPWAEQEDSAYVRTWYDQSGNGNDAGQSTAAEQPKLITAGVTETENGEPAIVFDGANDALSTTYESSTTTNSIFGVVKADSTSDDASWIQLINSSASTGVSMGQGGLGTAAEWGLRLYEGSDTDKSGIAMTIYQTLLTGLTIAATSAQIYANGVAGGLTTSARLQVGGLTTIGATNTSNEFAGKIQELIVYESDQSANRIGIETNINNHYGIY